MNMLLYHGSNIRIENPRLIDQTRGLDFGAGFYLTTNETQAIRFSEIVVGRRKTGNAIVSVYEFDLEHFSEDLLIKKFESADIKWLDFVTENRLKIYAGQTYDIVIGAVANDTVMPTIQAYLSGFLNEEATLITLKTSKLVDQWCLKSEKSISMLKFLRAFEVREVK